MDVLLVLLISFLVGVGVGTFVLGARIRKVVAEATAVSEEDFKQYLSWVRAEISKEKAAVSSVGNDIKKAL